MFKKGDKVSLKEEEPTVNRPRYSSDAVIIKLIEKGYLLSRFKKWENDTIPIVVIMRPQRSTGGLEETGTLHASGKFLTK